MTYHVDWRSTLQIVNRVRQTVVPNARGCTIRHGFCIRESEDSALPGAEDQAHHIRFFRHNSGPSAVDIIVDLNAPIRRQMETNDRRSAVIL